MLDFADEDYAWLESHLRTTTRDVIEWSQEEGTRILNLMLPKGVSPPTASRDIVERVWNRESRGTTIEDRLDANRRKFAKRLRRPFTSSLKEVKYPRIPWSPEREEEYQLAQAVLEVWNSGAWLGSILAENEPWISGLVSMAYEMDTKGEELDVIDHWVFKAELDNVTCEECAALDGSDLGDTLGLEGSSLEIDQNISLHLHCRCIAVPVTKTWEELGFPPQDEPEGTRIVRTTSEGRASPTGYIAPDGTISPTWQPGYQPTGGNQEYVPASTRYEDWIRRQQ